MYRKVCLLLFLNFQTLNLFMKLTIIMGMMFIMMLMIAEYQPFIMIEHNYLEYFSSISSFFLIFAAYLYLSEVNNFIKAICFVVINITNFLFFVSWSIGTLKILIFKYRQLFLKHMPRLVFIIDAINSTLLFIVTRNCLNPFKIAWYFRAYYERNKTLGMRNSSKNKQISFKNELNPPSPRH